MCFSQLVSIQSCQFAIGIQWYAASKIFSWSKGPPSPHNPGSISLPFSLYTKHEFKKAKPSKLSHRKKQDSYAVTKYYCIPVFAFVAIQGMLLFDSKTNKYPTPKICFICWGTSLFLMFISATTIKPIKKRKNYPCFFLNINE